MTRRKRHFVQISGVPSAHDNTPVIGLVFNLVNDILELIHTLASVVILAVFVLCAEVTPLETINGT